MKPECDEASLQDPLRRRGGAERTFPANRPNVRCATFADFRGGGALSVTNKRQLSKEYQ